MIFKLVFRLFVRFCVCSSCTQIVVENGSLQVRLDEQVTALQADVPVSDQPGRKSSVREWFLSLRGASR
jgi:hypothetical protein